jgi:hypothetical protein
MDRFAQGFASVLLLAGAALSAGCSGASGLLGGPSAAAGAPPTFSNEHPLARPMAVAWTSARAQRCGFYFDPGKLKSSYLAYEAGQLPPDQLAKVEQTYDSTFRTVRQQVAGDPEYCSDSKSADIKKELTRHLAGDFTPNFPKQKVVETCGFLGAACADTSGPFDTKKFWEDQARNTSR